MQQESSALPVAASDMDVVMCNSLFDHHPVSSFSRLKLVQATSAGLDRLPLEELATIGVRVEPARDVYSPAIAEFVMLLLLQIFKASSSMLSRQQRREWQKERGLRELTGLTACIVGLGSIGREVATRLTPFGISITSIGRGTSSDDRDQRLATADIVILSAPLTPETYHFMDSRRLASMQKNSVLINVARGQLVDEAELIKLLDQGHFYGVGLDVFENEPLPPDSQLWDYDRVIVTPHNSFVSDQSADRLVSLLIRNLSEFA
ncbi:MAG: D-2-hydroxyacid dehydrogenase [Yaniella sp.]|nr:D-2-hydroxyacid dehydrogenase [Yaniella sp.]